MRKSNLVARGVLPLNLKCALKSCWISFCWIGFTCEQETKLPLAIFQTVNASMNVLNVFGPVLVSKLNEGDQPVVTAFKSLRIVFFIHFKIKTIKV